MLGAGHQQAVGQGAAGRREALGVGAGEREDAALLQTDVYMPGTSPRCCVHICTASVCTSMCYQCVCDVFVHSVCVCVHQRDYTQLNSARQLQPADSS